MGFATASTGLGVLHSSDCVSAHPKPTEVHRATRAVVVWQLHALALRVAAARQIAAPAWPVQAPEVATRRSAHGHASVVPQPADRSIHIRCCRPPYAWERAHNPGACSRSAALAATAKCWTP